MGCCASCAKMNLNDKNSSGCFWCGEHKKYYPGSDSSCGYFVARDDSGGCFITTIIVECLGYDDFCMYLENLRGFRDNVMKHDPQYNELLEAYDTIGPVVAEHISRDEQKMVLAEKLLETYVKPVCNFVNSGKHEVAVGMYKKMVDELKERYNL